MTGDWRDQASCAQVGGDLWFPDDDTSAYSELPRARAICAACEVRQKCLDVAVADPELEGIWAGTTPQQRAHIRGIWSRDCRWCGDRFTATQRNHLYCCDECRHEGRLETKRKYDERRAAA